MEFLKYLNTHEAHLFVLLIVTAVWGFLIGRWSTKRFGGEK